MKKYLPLRFSGVLQYFSDNNAIGFRQTYNTSLYPTKAAVVGLIAAAFGYNRDDTKIQELFNALSLKYEIVKPPIILDDFQTVNALKSQSNYMNKYSKGTKFKTMAGGYREAHLIKHVQYLQNAEFIVYISGSEQLLLDIFNAIQDPVYSLYLGKRSCIPNKPIVTTFELINEEDLTNVYDYT